MSLLAAPEATRKVLALRCSLIPTINGALLHPDGVAILYADHVTDCCHGIEEIEWPRATHIACKRQTVAPWQMQKKFKELIDGVYNNAAEKPMLEGASKLAQGDAKDLSIESQVCLSPILIQ